MQGRDRCRWLTGTEVDRGRAPLELQELLPALLQSTLRRRLLEASMERRRTRKKTIWNASLHRRLTAIQRQQFSSRPWSALGACAPWRRLRREYFLALQQDVINATHVPLTHAELRTASVMGPWQEASNRRLVANVPGGNFSIRRRLPQSRQFYRA